MGSKGWLFKENKKRKELESDKPKPKPKRGVIEGTIWEEVYTNVTWDGKGGSTAAEYRRRRVTGSYSDVDPLDSSNIGSKGPTYITEQKETQAIDTTKSSIDNPSKITYTVLKTKNTVFCRDENGQLKPEVTWLPKCITARDPKDDIVKVLTKAGMMVPGVEARVVFNKSASEVCRLTSYPSFPPSTIACCVRKSEKKMVKDEKGLKETVVESPSEIYVFDSYKSQKEDKIVEVIVPTESRPTENQHSVTLNILLSCKGGFSCDDIKCDLCQLDNKEEESSTSERL